MTQSSDSPQPPGVLADQSWLQARLGDAGVRPVDLRDSDAFAAGHIPGAVHLDLAELGTHRDGCDSVLLGDEDFERLMAGLGVSTGDTVVAYDDQWGLAAARLLWALHSYGHRAVAVLNGGWDSWQERGAPVEVGTSQKEAAVASLEGATNLDSEPGGDVATPSASDAFKADPDSDVVADRAWVSQEMERSDVRLLDTRSEAEFDQGHIPGALSWDWFRSVPDGDWTASRDVAELRSAWAELGIQPTDEVVVYCRSGMRAAHTYLVLRHAGFSGVRLYDGSWQEWSATMVTTS
jgi:thiosulfate/3-mercaptopyruvate sulfurtransferase